MWCPRNVVTGHGQNELDSDYVHPCISSSPASQFKHSASAATQRRSFLCDPADRKVLQQLRLETTPLKTVSVTPTYKLTSLKVRNSVKSERASEREKEKENPPKNKTAYESHRPPRAHPNSPRKLACLLPSRASPS